MKDSSLRPAAAPTKEKSPIGNRPQALDSKVCKQGILQGEGWRRFWGGRGGSLSRKFSYLQCF